MTRSNPSPPAVRVLLADGRALLRTGFRLLLEATEPISVVECGRTASASRSGRVMVAANDARGC
jgi:hypothetical protein